MSALSEMFADRQATPSDINEHMEVLRALATQCAHITEFGVRSGNSTIAFMDGMDHLDTAKLVSYDINDCSNADLSAAFGRRWESVQADTGKLDGIEETDLLFIDTLHNRDHVLDELLHANSVRRFIVMHDTVLFGCHDETGDGPGIVDAIFTFLSLHREWVVVMHYTNNCGLLIMERR